MLSGMNKGIVTFGEFRLEAGERRLTLAGVPVELSGRYLDALLLLVGMPGELVSKDRFMAEVWRGIPVTDEALTQCIRSLRRALGDDAARPRFIETIPKYGYRFIAQVTPEETVDRSDSPENEPLPAARGHEAERRGLAAGPNAARLDGAAPERGLSSRPSREGREEGNSKLDGNDTATPHPSAASSEPTIAVSSASTATRVPATTPTSAPAAPAAPDPAPAPAPAPTPAPAAAPAPASAPAPAPVGSPTKAASINNRLKSGSLSNFCQESVALEPRDQAGWLLMTGAGLAGGAVAGLVGGLGYGLLAAGNPPAGTGAISVVLVITCLCLLIGLLGGLGVGAGIAAARMVSGDRLFPAMLGGALGGLLVGSLGRLVGLDAFALLVGSRPLAITGGSEGLLIGALAGAGAWLAQRQGSAALRMTALQGAGLGAAAGLLVVAGGGQMMAGSLAVLAESHPGAPLGSLLGAGTLSPLLRLLTGAIEGAVFIGALSLAFALVRRRPASGH